MWRRATRGARFCLQCGQAVAGSAAASLRSPTPETYTPRHLAEKILTSKAALEGERKQVTVSHAISVVSSRAPIAVAATF